MMNYAIPSSVYQGIAGLTAPMAAPAAVDPTAYAMPQPGFTADWASSIAGGATAGFGGMTPGMTPPQTPGLGSRMATWLGDSRNLSSVFQGISALTDAYLGFAQLRQAKEGLKLQKQAFEANLRNSTQAYNTSLEDRIRGRTSNYEGKENDVQAYLAAHRLSSGG